MSLDDAPSFPRLGYGFAKSNGVILMADTPGGPLGCHFRPGASVDVLMEAQRRADQPIVFVPIEAEDFEAALGRIYRDSASEAAEAAAGDDLNALADTAAAVDDLLDQNDDAPVVRLINALMVCCAR